MFIVMHCMGIPFNGNTIKERSLGGSETAAYYMAKELAAMGHKVTLFTTSSEDSTADGVRYLSVGQVTEASPLGERFHFYAESTPHDVLIIQRHPQAFQFPYAAKLKFWWLHDLAMIRRAGEVQPQLWNINGVFTVSEFHKKQVCEIYGFNPERVFPIQNGIDLDLFEGELENEEKLNADKPWKSIDDEKVNLLYTSRPERGLEHLVGTDGIMERLAKIDSKYHLYVCGYDNTTEQMASYYAALEQRCNNLENVTRLGSLTKQELADVMRQCDALVYPTPGPLQPGFEEVSCITAMECMAAGLPFISSKVGALPETCKDSGSTLIELKNGMPNLEKFVKSITIVTAQKKEKLKERQKEAAHKFAWSFAASMVDDIIDDTFIHLHQNKGTILKELIRTSDVYAAKKCEEEITCVEEDKDPILYNTLMELDECYAFAWTNTWKEHYEKVYEREADRGVAYGPEDLTGNNRFEHVSGLVSNFPNDCRILDYGCAHGHYTVNLAKRFPEKQFVGVDIEASNIEKARKWAEEEKLSNITFYNGWVNEDGVIELPGRKGTDEKLSLDKTVSQVDCIIAAEVVEHVASPQHLVDSLATYLSDKGVMILTTPFGPWEAQGYEEHWPWRAHVHHYERADLHNLFSHHKDFGVSVAPSGRSKWGDPLGSYVTTFGKPTEASGDIDYKRKLDTLAPVQTVSLCMIVCNAEETLLRTLNSAKGIADEIIIAIDPKTTDSTLDIIETFKKGRNGLWPTVNVIEGLDPLEHGFDAARNKSIEEASGDWILWLDSDEILVHDENMFKYLQDNMFDGYSIKQHHFAVEPLGVMKTDMPVRLFRNGKGIQFFGVVHEHPEKELNQGAGHVQLIHDLEIAHQGYTTEAIRRKRFSRNIELMVRDREKYPDRHLGKFLWIRDLAQMCQYEMQNNGGRLTPQMRQRAEQGLKLWEELLDGGQIRMIVDGLQFYSTLSQIKGGGFEFAFSIDSSKMNGGTHLEQAKPIKAHFSCREHVDKLFNALTNEKVKSYDSRYF